MARSVPVRLRIPAIGVDSTLMGLGLTPKGTLETPPGAFPAGWFKGAPTPGEIGPAIIVGHVRYVTPGVFARLTDLRPDDKILVKRKDGSTATFRVTRLAHFAKSNFPTKRVYGNIDHAGLRLITCGGLDADTNVFEENVVVFADLQQS
jgi:sortase (surface protein transpeptidase)